MIIGRDLMVQLDLSADLKHQVLQWGGINKPIKEPIGQLGQTDLTSYDMRKVAMKTPETVSTVEAT